MATIATVPPPQQPQGPSIPLLSLTHIDITTLSQSDLQTLSLFSSSSSTAINLLVPKIDRSVFNESAGSRRQTYYRPRRSQSDNSVAAATCHRRRVAGLHATPKPSPVPPDNPEHNENHAIIVHLRHFISQDPKFDQIDLEATRTTSPSLLLRPDHEGRSGVMGFEGRAEMGVMKRKRGRKPKGKVLRLEDEGYVDMEIVNKDGGVVDVLGLSNAEDPFGEELRRRTAGLETEEELLGFMRKLGGQWGSRRKKRKIVDASEFGDTLPIGWKLLLALKRTEGRAWVYCRRYISPTGQQFLSCMEVSSFLHSFFGLNNAERPHGHGGDNIHGDCLMTIEKHDGMDGGQRQDVNSSPALVASSLSNEQDKEVDLSGMENLADVQIHNLFECHKCSLTFGEKDSYLQHLLSFHQKTTRRYRLGSTVGDGVIIKDGKYECQFCHKVFPERRRYNGHVGIHVRNYVRRVEESPGPTLQKRIESPIGEGLSSRISKMNALIEIAQSSILETSISEPNALTKGRHSSNSSQQMNIESLLCEPDLEGGMLDRIGSDQQDSEHTVTDGSMEEADDAMEMVDVKMDSYSTTVFAAMEKNAKPSESTLEKDGQAFSYDELKSGTNPDGASKCQIHASLNEGIFCDVTSKKNITCSSALEHPKAFELSNNKNIEPDVYFSSCSHHGVANGTLVESVRKPCEENGLQIGISECSMSLVQPSICFPTSNKEESQLSSVGHGHEHGTGFDELRLDKIEPLKYGFRGGHKCLALQEVPMDLTNNDEMETAFGSSVQFASEEIMLTTLCVWCGEEFNHEAADSEIQPDSVGFMCPTCKAKISGQLNVLDNMPVNNNCL